MWARPGHTSRLVSDRLVVIKQGDVLHSRGPPDTSKQRTQDNEAVALLPQERDRQGWKALDAIIAKTENSQVKVTVEKPLMWNCVVENRTRAAYTGLAIHSRVTNTRGSPSFTVISVIACLSRNLLHLSVNGQKDIDRYGLPAPKNGKWT